MKVSPKADFPIQVIPEVEEREGLVEGLFEGIFRAVLNHTVDVVFVPDVSAVAPPWDYHTLPGSLDGLTTVEQARIVTAFTSPYLVTPNVELAGTVERVEWSADGEPEGSQSVVFYVMPAEFDRYAAELERLSELVFSKWPKERASDLRRFEVVLFLERKVVDSGWLDPEDAAMLGRRP
jgi:hypothetical protein